MKKLILILTVCTSISLAGCSGSVKNDIPTFPAEYQAYLDSIPDGKDFPVIGHDGDGFQAISQNVEYLLLPDKLKSNSFADSLSRIYNMGLAFNAGAYDCGTADRYVGEWSDSIRIAFSESIGKINLTGVIDEVAKDAIQSICDKASSVIATGELTSETRFDAIDVFYDRINSYINPILSRYGETPTDDWSDGLPNYDKLHEKALTDTIKGASDILNLYIEEKDFHKKCVYAREWTLAEFSNGRDAEMLVAVIDPLLRSGEYSPLLADLWLRWRTALQIYIFGGRSNDSSMYNLFYNSMKNKVALVHIKQLAKHPDDAVAFKEFMRLCYSVNICRNSGALFGNNAILDEMELYDECRNKAK